MECEKPKIDAKVIIVILCLKKDNQNRIFSDLRQIDSK